MVSTQEPALPLIVRLRPGLHRVRGAIRQALMVKTDQVAHIHISRDPPAKLSISRLFAAN